MIGALLAAALLGAATAANAGDAASGAAFRRRGVLEGFYGKPWTWEQRRSMVRWMGAQGFNLFVLAPKDEPLQRADWRRPLTPEYLSELKRLASEARAVGVELAWVLSPGLDLKPGDAADVRAAAAKLKTVLGSGVVRLALAFDDTEPDPAHVDFANAVREALEGVAELTFIPAEYWTRAAPSPYLDAVAQRLHPSFLVGVAGGGILNRAVKAEEMRRFKEYIRHEVVLGDNYPVQDRLAYAGRLFLGPLQGRDPALSGVVAGFLANASPLAEASQLPLSTVAEFLKDPSRYDPEAALRRAARSLAKPEAREALQHFVSLNRSSWIYPNEAAAADWRRAAGLHESLSGKLPAGLERELSPWIGKLELLTRALDGDREAARRAAESPAVVADFALEKALRNDHCGGLRGKLAAHARGETVPELSVCLESLANARGGLLVPAGTVLGLAADRAGRALAGRPPAKAFDRFYRWRARAAFLPLLLARRFLEAAIARRWKLPRLYAALERWERRGLPDEALPWQWKVRDYGRAAARSAAGLSVTPEEYESLRSGNGLEIALELKQALDAFVLWSRLPEPRPKELDLELPPDPADLL